MSKIDLTAKNVENLDVFANPCDPRRDLHVFMDYVADRRIKRLHRDNRLAKTDATALAKLMTDPRAVDEINAHGDSDWVDYIDQLARALGFIDYDTKGEYAGYSSVEPSFPNNYIAVDTRAYERFLSAPLQARERRLLSTLLQGLQEENNEFFQRSVFSRLRPFPIWGSATGVIPTLDFSKIRRFLLNVLQQCDSDVWYSTASLIQHLKAEHPFFLIPKKPKFKHEGDRKQDRYINFCESKDDWGREIQITAEDADAFERVEGRYVERFIEGVPLIMGYVEVAYCRAEYKGLFPDMGQLEAFRVEDRFLHAMAGEIPAPKVTVQPNFELHVESEFYPAHVLSQLTPLADVVREETTITLKLRKKKVLTRLSNDDSLDVIALLQGLSRRELPQNIRIELEEWSGDSEVFTLHEKVALLEGDEDLPAADRFIVESISPTIRIVRSPDRLFTALEKEQLVPLRVKHRASTLTPLPEKARTVFATATQPTRPKEREAATLKRAVAITLHLPTRKLLEKFRKELVTARCPIKVDQNNLAITFSQQHEPQVKKIIKGLAKDYVIRIEDLP